MARGPKKHLKRIAAPKSWMLDKLGGIFATKPSQGPHKYRESLPLTVVLKNRLKYALTGREVTMIVNDKEGNIEVDGKLRRDPRFPTGLMDVITIKKTGELYRVLYDVKGRFVLRSIKTDEGKYKLCSQLLGNSNVDEASPISTPKMVGEDRLVPPVDSEFDQHSEPSNIPRSDIPSVSCDADKSCLISPLESQSRQIRSCTKVHMQGIAVGRAVDLTRFNQYDDLLRKLEEMFDIEGELCGSLKKWQVVYTDDEDDMMMVGDDPWNEFCSMVRKIFIYTTEEVKRLSPKIKLPLGGDGKLCKPDSDTIANHTEDQSSIVGSDC